MSEGYQSVDNNEVGQVRDALEALVTEGAGRMLESALEEEVSTFLGRDSYQRGNEFRGYRNGYHRSREITVGLNPVRVKVSRVSEAPTEVSTDGVTSQIVHQYEKVSKKTQELFRKLYVEGLATGDFEPVFRELIGETAALSANTIVRLKATWGSITRHGARDPWKVTPPPTSGPMVCIWELLVRRTRAPCCAC